MIYSQAPFILLLLAVALLCQIANERLRRYIFGIGSLIFLTWAGIVTVLLLVATATVVWGTIRLSQNSPVHSGKIYITGIILLLSNLIVWKYVPWLEAELLLPRSAASQAILNIGLPIGISFYTLQAISYLADRRRDARMASGFTDIFLFIIFFGHLVAGPIVRHADLMTQVQHPRRATADDVIDGAALFVLGFFKKVFLADRAASYADPIFADLTAQNWLTILLACMLYTVQIWADFSGYTDMGRGAARICGVDLPINFRAPYLARSPQDFWRRWHISLSSWLRDYLYIPLGGNRHGPVRTYFNLAFTMVVCGIWHGAQWTFLLWGGWHAFLLIGQRLLQGSGLVPSHAWLKPLGWAFTMLCVMLGWLLFRLPTPQDFWQALCILGSVRPGSAVEIIAVNLPLVAWTGLFTIACLIIQWFEGRPAMVAAGMARLGSVGLGAALGLVVVVALALRGKAAPFIYFAF
jgi:alginate O-acetyltransferase complex protein AlgI